MNEIIQQLEQSIEDHHFFKSEKKAIKAAILEKKFTKREFDFLRSKIFDIAKNKSGNVASDKLIDWLETANKLTLLGSENQKSNDHRAYFSPGTQCQDAIVSHIKNAVSNLKICVFTISDNVITRAIEEAHNKNINIKIITDNDKTEDLGSDIHRLNQIGIDVKIDRTANHMHHKFCIVDSKTLITGSYNWTRSAAQHNQENILITEDIYTTRQYLKEFEKLWNTLVNY